MNYLQPIAYCWKELGLQLGINFGELNVIEATRLLIPGGPAAFLQEILFRYLNFAPPSHQHPTLEKLCKALRSRAIRQDRLAFDLEQEYQARSTGLLSVVDKIVSTIHEALHVLRIGCFSHGLPKWIQHCKN